VGYRRGCRSFAVVSPGTSGQTTAGKRAPMLGKWPIPNELSEMSAWATGLWIRRVLVRAQEGQLEARSELSFGRVSAFSRASELPGRTVADITCSRACSVRSRSFPRARRRSRLLRRMSSLRSTRRTGSNCPDRSRPPEPGGSSSATRVLGAWSSGSPVSGTVIPPRRRSHGGGATESRRWRSRGAVWSDLREEIRCWRLSSSSPGSTSSVG